MELYKWGMSMRKIEKSYFPVFVSLLWAWVFWFLPSLILAISIYCHNYEYDNKNIFIEKGLLRKTHQSIPLYRILDISADENIFRYGKIGIHDKTKYVELKYVKRPLRITQNLRDYSENASRNNNVSRTEFF